jgi:hypothetical protein
MSHIQDGEMGDRISYNAREEEKEIEVEQVARLSRRSMAHADAKKRKNHPPIESREV